jgi:hypothetical protein
MYWMKSLVTGIFLLVTVAQLQAQSDSTVESGGQHQLKHAWLVSINNSTMYTGFSYPSIVWKCSVTPRVAMRVGFRISGQLGSYTSNSETEYSDSSRSPQARSSGNEFGGTPTQFSFERQYYWSDPAEFRFYHVVGGSIGLSYSSNHRSSSGSTRDSKSYGISVGPQLGLGLEWKCQPRFSLFIENQVYLVFGWLWAETDSHYSGSNRYKVHSDSKSWDVATGLGYTKFGAAYYF